MTADELKILQKTLLIAHKPYLTFEELMLYTGRKRTFLTTMLSDYGIKKSSTGYYDRGEIDNMMAGGPTLYERKAKEITIRI